MEEGPELLVGAEEAPRRSPRWRASRRAACSRRSAPSRGRAGRARRPPARRRTSSRCARSRSRPRRRSAGSRGGRRARGPRAGSRAGASASPPRPGPAARRSTATSSSSWEAISRSISLDVAGRRPVGLEQQRAEGRVEEVDAADRDRADRVAVVGVLEADERAPAHVLAAALLPVLERHLQRDLDRGRAGVRVEDPVQPRRGELDQARGQLGGAGVGERRAWSSGRPGRAGRGPPGRSADGDGRGRCTTARRRRRGSGGPRLSISSVPSARSIISGSSLDPVPLLRERVPEVRVIELCLRPHLPRQNKSRRPDARDAVLPRRPPVTWCWSLGRSGRAKPPQHPSGPLRSGGFWSPGSPSALSRRGSREGQECAAAPEAETAPTGSHRPLGEGGSLSGKATDPA